MKYQNLIDRTFINQVDFHQTIGSTNIRAMQLAESPDLTLPTLVIAEQQTAGRGRGANRWWSADGALTFSVILDLSSGQLSVDRRPQISLIVGLAISEAFRSLDQQLVTGLKWPNDIFISGKKVCGILTEVPAKNPDRVVIGVGVNVNNSFQHAPPEIQEIGTSLTDQLQRALDLFEVLEKILLELQETLELFTAGNLALAASWQHYCILKGRHVEVNAGNQQIRGVCQGVDDDGALLLDDGEQVHRCYGGVVAHRS